MRKDWKFQRNPDHSHTQPVDYQFSQGFGPNLLSQFGSLVELSFNRPTHFIVSGSLALQEAFNCVSKFAGSFVLWYSNRPNSSVRHIFPKKPQGLENCQSSASIEHDTSDRRNLGGTLFTSGSDSGCATQVLFTNIARSTLWHLWKQVEQTKVLPMISLAAALVPPFDNLSPKVLAESIPLGNSNAQLSGQLNHSFSEDDCLRCHGRPMSNITWERDASEPNTGIKFPVTLNSSVVRDHNPHLGKEVLVGTGSKSMRIIKIRYMKVYAFGLYVLPGSICDKLWSKYASVPVSELKNHSEFYKDLLREDIHMTLRLVVNCNGVKINTVRDVFEKSLRNRLEKMNPNTDYNCLQAFGSYFKQDIPLPVGTTIDFKRTADGELITEIGGKMVGAVHSKDLCRAFFDMYIGDGPVSVQAKEEIAKNVAGIIRRC